MRVETGPMWLEDLETPLQNKWWNSSIRSSSLDWENS